mmetsp:Transcript_79530/g.200021  ORF Transcript_79530/g.200021 Transcript_79530/m.200021 type:complete len:245 (-) Transcript_79530:618-1352(-)
MPHAPPVHRPPQRLVRLRKHLPMLAQPSNLDLERFLPLGCFFHFGQRLDSLFLGRLPRLLGREPQPLPLVALLSQAIRSTGQLPVRALLRLQLPLDVADLLLGLAQLLLQLRRDRSVGLCGAKLVSVLRDRRDPRLLALCKLLLQAPNLIPRLHALAGPLLQGGLQLPHLRRHEELLQLCNLPEVHGLDNSRVGLQDHLQLLRDDLQCELPLLLTQGVHGLVIEGDIRGPLDLRQATLRVAPDS